MTWLSWRQQRAEAAITAAVLAMLAAVLIPTGLHMANAYDHAGLAACLGHGSARSCGPAVDAFEQQFRATGSLIAWFTLVPGLIGILLAAPIILALEHRTYRLDWTQSITRRRWITSKLGLAVVTALVASAALTLLVIWWRGPLVHISGRMENSVFDSEGTVPLAYVLFALGSAVAIGAVWRRTAPALVVAFIAYFAVRLFTDTWVRQRLVTPLTATWKSTAAGPRNLDHAWILSQHPSDRLGHAVSGRPSVCVRSAADCVAHHGPNYMHAVYQPATRFWSLQGTETALFAGAALLLVGFAAWWIHERVA